MIGRFLVAAPLIALLGNGALASAGAPASAGAVPDCKASASLAGKGAIELSLTCPYQGVGKVSIDAKSKITHIQPSLTMRGETSDRSSLECRRAEGTALCTGGLVFGTTATGRFKVRGPRCQARISLTTRGGGPCGTPGGPCKKALIPGGRKLGAPAGC